MLGQILAALGTQSSVIKLSASKALTSIPFGAVNARIGANVVRSNDYYDVLNNLLMQVQDALQSYKRVFLIVDNSEYLDPQSAAIILQVFMSSDVKLILVDQPGSHNSQLRELWRDGYLTRFELGPLQTEDVREFVEKTLGGPVASHTVNYLSSRSAGIPLVLDGLLVGASEEGSLRQVNGMWVLDHPGDRLGGEPWEFIRMALEHLEPASREIVEILALAGPLSLDTVLELSTPEAVDDIQRRELVEISAGPGLTMKLFRPATATSIRALVPIGRSRKLLAQVSQFLPAIELQCTEQIINITRWMLDCGLSVDDGQILLAATRANQAMRPKEALQFCGVSVGPENFAALLAEGAIARLNQNKFGEARSQALRAFDLATTPEVAATAVRAVHLSHFADSDYESCINHVLEQFQERFGAVSVSTASSRAEIEVLTVMVMRDVTLGDLAASSTTVVDLLAHPLTNNVSDRVQLKSLHIEAMCAGGQMGPAVSLAGEIIAEMEAPEGFPRADISLLAYSRAVSAMIYDGRWDYAQVALKPEVFVNTDLMLFTGGLRDLAAGVMACRRGHFDESLPALRSAVGALTDYDPWSVLPSALGLLAYSLAIWGDLDGAQEQLSHRASLNRRSGRFQELEASAYGAVAQFLVGQNEMALAKLHNLRRECRERGYTGIELTVLSLLMRVGDETAIPALAQVASGLESSSRTFFQEWARAMESQEPTDLEHASGVAAEYGFDLIAVELATHAQKKFSDHGKEHKSRKTADKVVSMREQIPGLATPVFNLIDPPKMTRREHQIALLVAQGESNNSIASRLHVSLRTIEGHLYRTFIKLDIQSREQLATLINGEESGSEPDSYYS